MNIKNKMARLEGYKDLEIGIEHITCAISWLEEYDECKEEVMLLQKIKEKLKQK